MTRNRFATRTIRHGTVRWFGRRFRVAPTQRVVPAHVSNPEAWANDPAYDGRLDGLRATFTEYGHDAFPDSLFLHSFGNEWPGPSCINGYFVWERWDAIR